MNHILIIDGHQKYAFAKGRLSRTLVSQMKKVLKSGSNIKESVIEEGYDIKEEQEKFLWADTIIFQFPIFWFGMPAPLKQYIQDVYEHGIFFSGSDEGYGRGGFLSDKTYMLSTTWNAPLSSFGHGFWKGIPTPDAALTAMHHTQSFIGMKKLPSFSCHDVVKNPQVDAYLEALERHLSLIFNN